MLLREFELALRLLGGAAVAWPVVARAQQAKRVGVLDLGNVDAQSFRTELREGLRKSGYIEGQSIEYAFRSADDNATLSKLAAELVALKVDVLVALYTPCVVAAQQATRETPIVSVSGDPVRLGLVASLARPGGNITGISLMAAELYGKCVQVFHDMLPSVQRVAVVINGGDALADALLEEVRLAGRTTGIEIAPVVAVRGQDGARRGIFDGDERACGGDRRAGQLVDPTPHQSHIQAPLAGRHCVAVVCRSRRPDVVRRRRPQCISALPRLRA